MSHSQLHRVEACAYTCMAKPLRQAYYYWQDQPGMVDPAINLARARRRALPARVRAPTRARAGPPRASLAGTRPQPGPGGFGRPGASPHASEERASGRGPSCPCGVAPAGARQPPACAALSLGPVQAASDARARLPAPRRSAPQAGPGAELPMWGGPKMRRPLSSPPVFGRGGASGAQAGGPRPARGRDWARHTCGREGRSPDPRGGRTLDLGRPDRCTRGCQAAEVPRCTMY